MSREGTAVRLGFGPVFVYECITLARRWQLYATRVFFVGALLAALVTVWLGQLHGRGLASIGRDAEAGEKFFYGVVGTELTLVLLLAPAATAGAICVDKTRGTLAHMLVTDLTDFEIVVGKLAARFVPVLGLVAGTAPILFLGVLLGGIDPEAVLGSLVVMLATAMLGSAIAMALSVWGRKTHEVLLGTFAIIGLWLLAGQLWYEFMIVALGVSGRPPWTEDINPFYLAFAAYRRPGVTLGAEYGRYFAVCGGLSVLLAALATWRTRRVYVRQLGGPARRGRRFRIGGVIPWLVRRLGVDRAGWGRLNWSIPRLPGPSLDGNPVLWREWHRASPSRFARVTWAVYAVVATASTVVAMWHGWTTTGGAPAGMAAWVNALQVSVGMLLLSVSAATALADERDRGTLDALLATPLSTRSIVWGKWWGSFRRVPLLAVLPTLLVAALSLRRGYLAAAIAIAALVLCYGAFLTSLGLAVATWVQRIGRTISIVVSVYVFLCVGWVFLVVAVNPGHDGMLVAMLSPFMGIGNLTFEACDGQPGTTDIGIVWPLGWGVAYVGAAVLLFLVTLVTFDRRLGRMPERIDFAWQRSAPWPMPIEPHAGLSPASNEVVVLPPATLLPSVECQSSRPTCASSPADESPAGQRAD